jgi:hypothetical protein
MGGNLSHDASIPPQQSQPQYPNTQYPNAQYGQPQAGHAQPPQPPRPQPGQAVPLLGMDPATWPVIRQSATRLYQNEDAFVQQLHYDITRLISAPPGTPAPDIWAFCARMARSLLWVALSDQPLGVVADVLRQVGGQNWVEGFADAVYETFAHAMVQTVHYLCDWSTSVASAWISYFTWIKPHLVAGAQQAAAEHASTQQAAAQQAADRLAAAEQEAARVEALSRDSHGGHTQVVGDVNLESVASLLDDEDDENASYGQIMVAMTQNQRRKPPRRTS